MSLSQKQVQSISQTVFRKFPEMAGQPPTIRPQAGPAAKAAGAKAGPAHYLLTFKGSAAAPDGKVLRRLVRVVVEESGKIVKISTSR